MTRYKNEANRLYGVLEKQLKASEWLACDEYTIADMATMPWLRAPERQGVNIDEFPHVKRWRDRHRGAPGGEEGRWKCSPIAGARRRASTRSRRRCSSARSNMLDDKVAWITGGGSGIGLAAAVELAKAGAKVVISGRSEATLKAALKTVKAEALACDVGGQGAGGEGRRRDP